MQRYISVPLRRRLAIAIDYALYNAKIVLRNTSLNLINSLRVSIAGEKLHPTLVRNLDVQHGEPWLRDLLEKVGPTVVEVSVVEERRGKVVADIYGSGVIVKADGTILTAFDLVANHRWWFGREWTPKGQIMVCLYDGKRFAANLVVVDKESGIAVLKINSEEQFTAAVVGISCPILLKHSPIVNLEWPPIDANSVIGRLSSRTRDVLHMSRGGYRNVVPTIEERFGGPVFDYHGNVVGISREKLPGDGSIFATPIENAMKILGKQSNSAIK